MMGSMQSRPHAFEPTLSAGDARPMAARRPAPPRRHSLLDPTALPLGFALGCCLGLISALIAFF